MTEHNNNTTSARRHVSIIDILFAVSIGAGFTVGFYDLRHDIATLAFLRDASLALTVARLMLAYVIITISWFYFHASVKQERPYQWGEFVTDLLVYYTYMMLFAFIEHAPAFYVTLTAVWMLYAVSLLAAADRALRDVVYNFSFVALFVLLATSALFFDSIAVEWARLLAAAAITVIYRLFRPEKKAARL